MCWSNDGAGANGPDDMVFRFLNERTALNKFGYIPN